MGLKRRFAALEGRVAAMYDYLDERFADLRHLLENDLRHQAAALEELRAWRQQVNGWRAEQAGKTGRLEGSSRLVLAIFASIILSMISAGTQILTYFLGLSR